MNDVKVTERGWPGHFIMSDRCLFRRNTLIEGVSDTVVVSTVGCLMVSGEMKTIGAGGRFYETMVFGADMEGPYLEADVLDVREIDPTLKCGIFADSKSGLPEDVDNQANDMHEAVVVSFCNRV